MKIKLLPVMLMIALSVSFSSAFAQEDEGAPSAPAASASGTYTIQKGDTLWDISKSRLSDPFAWPRIWKENPAIQDPDLIFPGQVIVLPPGVTIAPRAEAPAEAPEARPKPKFEGEAPFVEKGKMEEELPTVTEGNIINIPAEQQRVPVANAQAILSAGFIEENKDETRAIEGSPTPRALYGLLDELYVKPDGIKAGDKFIIGRYDDEVEDPGAKEVLGKLVRVSGVLEIEGPKDGFMEGKITRAFIDVRSTDLLFPYQEPLLVYEPIPLNPKAEDVSGFIAALKDEKKDVSQVDTLFIDKGAFDGVLPGDTFAVERPGDIKKKGCPAKPDVTVLPDEQVGRIQVISVRGHTAAAKVLKSAEPLQVGYRVYYSR